MNVVSFDVEPEWVAECGAQIRTGGQDARCSLEASHSDKTHVDQMLRVIWPTVWPDIEKKEAKRK